MSKGLPIWLVEPDVTEKKQGLAVRESLGTGQKLVLIPDIVSIDDIKQRLTMIRKHSKDNINSLIEELEGNLNQKYPQVKLKFASDNVEATRYISEISGEIKIVSTNNSSIVSQELKPGLMASGFTVINSYLGEFDAKEKERKFLDYWNLPRLFDKNIIGTFDLSIKMAGLADIENKKYIALLGVNAIAAEDGTIFFLQHFSNIYNDLRQANKVILVVGLDKIVKSREDAAFQTKCMGMFGMESVLLDIGFKQGKTPSIDELSLPTADEEREIHLLILDNGRTDLLRDNFSELFLCIGCRACSQHCPIRHSFTEVDYIWTPRNYLNQFLLGLSSSTDACLHCEACRLECPLDIDLPLLMWRAKIDYISKHSRTLKHKILGIPEMLAKLGTIIAPLSNWMMSIKLLRIPMEIITGIDRRTKLPPFHTQTFSKWFRNNA